MNESQLLEEAKKLLEVAKRSRDVLIIQYGHGDEKGLIARGNVAENTLCYLEKLFEKANTKVLNDEVRM